jgi:hypothetical protein
MAIPPQYFDQVLSAYGLTLVDVSKAPASYARKVGDKVVWEMAPRTYTPVEMVPGDGEEGALRSAEWSACCSLRPPRPRPIASHPADSVSGRPVGRPVLACRIGIG